MNLATPARIHAFATDDFARPAPCGSAAGLLIGRLRADAPGGPETLRPLDESDLPELLDHLLRLSADDRYSRFHATVQAPALQAYVRGINLHRDITLGLFRQGRLVAACHVGVCLESGAAVGEVGLSVDESSRGRGLARALIDAARRAAIQQDVRRLDMVYERGNRSMMLLARHLGGLIAQHFVQRCPVERLVLLAAVPPDGLNGPELDEALAALKTTLARRTLRAALDGLAPLVRPAPATRLKIIGGSRDRVVSPAAVKRTAAFHGAQAVMLDAGHALINGRAWREAAQAAVS